MSHKRSGLLPGLITGLIAALICAAALGAAVLFQTRLPAAVAGFGNGYPLSVASSLVIALLVALAMGAVRPRSVVLVPIAAVYAGGAVAAGQVVGSSIMIGTALRTPPAERGPADLSDVTLDNFTAGLPYAPSLYKDPLSETWAAWLYIAVAALAALALLTLRVIRIRRRQRVEQPETAGQPEGEPEYRAPFEPLQAPTPKPTADLFTPRGPAKDQPPAAS
ncbi:hypothetical protein GBF35_33120 [Nonomuraea phyllanthi]|uniref:hypothetical protein n=1 Tax=Nonomuraea phyllanthi TaxID=2219224 RepID=UPI001292E784|nr:hypothetical protein [Nonomuraea phyllanthi]QFY10809.1 hypothetical protein GBF35_33120 [Nonomuraea phyllanthi]